MLVQQEMNIVKTLGIDELSMAPDAIPVVKERLSEVALEQAQAAAKEAMLWE